MKFKRKLMVCVDPEPRGWGETVNLVISTIKENSISIKIALIKFLENVNMQQS